MDYIPPGSSVHGILQARTQEWVAISFSIIPGKCYINSCPKAVDSSFAFWNFLIFFFLSQIFLTRVGCGCGNADMKDQLLFNLKSGSSHTSALSFQNLPCSWAHFYQNLNISKLCVSCPQQAGAHPPHNQPWQLESRFRASRTPCPAQERREGTRIGGNKC